MASINVQANTAGKRKRNVINYAEADIMDFEMEDDLADHSLLSSDEDDGLAEDDFAYGSRKVESVQSHV